MRTNYPCNVANMMTFSGVLGGGEEPDPLDFITCCKLEEDQNGAVTLRSQTNMM